MQVQSNRLGAIDLDEAAILQFPTGLPGFEHCTRLAFVERPSVAPIVFLQSVDLPEVCFLAAPVTAIEPAYQLAMTKEDRNCIGAESTEDVVCLAILAPAEDGQFTANLLAPVVIDPKTRRAVQAVRADSRYSHRHPLKKGTPACS